MCCPPRGIPLMLPAVTGSHMLADLDSAAIASASVSTKFTGIGVSPLNPRKRLVLCNGPCPLWANSGHEVANLCRQNDGARGVLVAAGHDRTRLKIYCSSRNARRVPMLSL